MCSGFGGVGASGIGYCIEAPPPRFAEVSTFHCFYLDMVVPSLLNSPDYPYFPPRP